MIIVAPIKASMEVKNLRAMNVVMANSLRWRVVVGGLGRFRDSRLLSPRHSRESGNPEGGEAIMFDPGARASRPQSRACARRALTLALSHEGRGDPLAAIHARFSPVIPAKAGIQRAARRLCLTRERGRPARRAALARAAPSP